MSWVAMDVASGPDGNPGKVSFLAGPVTVYPIDENTVVVEMHDCDGYGELHFMCNYETAGDMLIALMKGNNGGMRGITAACSVHRPWDTYPRGDGRFAYSGDYDKDDIEGGFRG